jgi:choline dehydrogenase-like flavoprotein
MWQFSPPTRFGEKYRDELDRSGNIHVLLNANAVDVQITSSGSAVRQIKLKSLSGREGQVRAKAYVLACGGIENPRLLLDSNGVERDGVGNRRGLVGRYFLEHPHAIVAYAIPQTALDRYVAYYNSVEVAGIPIQVKPGVSEEVQRREGILNGCIDVGYGYDRSPGYLGVYHIMRNLRRGRMPSNFDTSLVQVLSDLDGAAGGLYRQLRGQNVLWFGANFEQAPNPDSRVLLSAERDRLGCRQTTLDWRLSAIDKHSLRVGCRIVGEELARLGLARMKMDAWLLKDDSTWDDLEGHFHHMGTTRMSDDPASGVVDADCRVHGISNLYVAGSSVFPSCGYANATLTIVALALRLADHLQEKV